METKNEIMIVDEKSLKDKIYVIRGQQVMLDFELAEIYGYSTKRFNEQIKNNIAKFDNDFMFQLTREEFEILRCKNCTSRLDDVDTIMRSKFSTASRRNDRYLPYAFSEQGIYMLMTVLRGDIAIKQSKALIRLFKSMKDYIVNNELNSTKQLLNLTIRQENVENRVENIEKNMIKKSELSKIINLFDTNTKNEEILILNGEPFKADLAYQRIFKKAKKSIIIVDDYIGVKTLQHLVHAKSNIDIKIISDNKSYSQLRLTEFNDFLKEYPKIQLSFIKSMNMIHDRFIVIDGETKNIKVYLCGSSSKDSGNRVTTIVELNETKMYKDMIDSLLTNKPLVLK